MTTGESDSGPHGDGVGPSAALARARSAALEELKRQPRAHSWKRHAAMTTGAVIGATLLVLMGGAWFSIVEPNRLFARWLPLSLLLGLQIASIYAAIVPGRSLLRTIAVVLAVAAATSILLGRGQGVSSSTPSFICSVSHLAVDLLPLAVVLSSLRRFSATPARSLLAGVAAAATGAMAGELSCGRNWNHVLLHHIGAGLLVAAACMVLSRWSTPKTFAP